MRPTASTCWDWFLRLVAAMVAIFLAAAQPVTTAEAQPISDATIAIAAAPQKAIGSVVKVMRAITAPAKDRPVRVAIIPQPEPQQFKAVFRRAGHGPSPQAPPHT